ncbi:MAG: cation diffusion facilitator family transporter [Candidatus Thorarchaeota archaeon]|nr:cation diffusion facilitator family transporter [Candidatus Thorarchaeota archaeon]
MLDRKEVSRAAAISVVAATALTLMKIAAGWSSNSLGIISEALHSGLDLIAAGITFIAVSRAAQAPDEDHPYGHGKIENFAALAETIILWITSVWIIYEAWRRIVAAEWAEATILGVGVMVISIIIDFNRSRMLNKVAKKHNSQALEADALHFSADMISSTVVLIGLILVWAGFPIGDPLAAIGVAIVIFLVSLKLGIRSYDILIDKAPIGLEARVLEICESIPSIRECKRVRARSSGPHVFVDVVITVQSDTTVHDAHTISDLVEKKVSGLESNVDCVVHIEPTSEITSPEGKQALFRILASLARAHPEIDSVHNARILNMPEGIHLVADLEMASSLTLEEAHAISEEFEESTKNLIPEITKISLHLESSESHHSATDVTQSQSELVSKVVELADSISPDCGCTDVQIVEDDIGLTLSLTCSIHGSTTLTESHDLADKIEKAIRKEIIDAKVFIHMEPKE